MADFETLEESVERSRPQEIYEITLGGDVYKYVSDDKDVTIDGDTYEAESVLRGNIKQGQDSRDDLLEIEFPYTNEFVGLYQYIVPGRDATLKIFRYQRDESPAYDTKQLLFYGFVSSVRFPDDGKAIVAVKSIEGMLSRPIPRYTYQNTCNHILYDNDCGALETSFKHTGEVTSVSGNVIVVDGADGFANGYFVPGYVKPTTMDDYRMVLEHTGTSLTVLLPFPVEVTGLDMECFAGCDHDINGDCITKFSRGIEFGGCAWVPTRDIHRHELD